MDKAQATSRTHAKKILVVADDLIAATDLKSELLKLGYEVPALVASGEDAVRKAAEIHPDLILMDIVLAGPMSGIAAATEINKSMTTPIVYLTDIAEAKTIAEAKKSEPFGYLIKPCNVATIMSTIEMALSKCAADARRRESADNLKSLQTEQRILLENIGAGVLFLKNRKIVWANPSMSRIFGYSVGELEGEDTRLLYPDQETYRKTGAAGYAALSRGEVYSRPVQMQKKDGSPLWCNIIGQAINPARLEEGTLWLLEDVTEQKRNEEQVQRLSDQRKVILDNIASCVFFLRKRIVQWANVKASTLFGYTLEEFRGEETLMLYPDNESFQKLGREAYPLLQQGESYSTERQMKKKGGELFWCRIVGQAINPLDLEQGSIWLVDDITERKLNEEALRESEEYFKALFEQAGDYILVLEPRDKGAPVIIDANRSACEKHGYTREELIGKPVTMLETDASRTFVQERKSKLMLGHAATFEGTHLAKDGSTFPVEISAKLVQIDNKKPVIFSIERDISEQKKYQKMLLDSAKNWQDTFDSISDAITIHDNDFNIIASNRSAKMLLGLSDAEGGNKKCFQYYHGKESPPFQCPSCQARNTGEHVLSEVFEPHLDRYLEIKAFPHFLEGKQIGGIVHIVRDISERKKWEDEILEARGIAEKANQAKSEFLDNMSHEFRTPLHAILSFSSFGISRIDKVDKEKLLDYFQKIHIAGEKLLPLVNDILDLSKLEAGKMQYTMKEHNLTTLVWEDAAVFETLVLDKNLRLKLPPATLKHMAVFDRDKIGQVIRNFLSNSIKFTPNGKTISIEITPAVLPPANTASGGEIAAITLCVTDEGIGIPGEELESVFEQFVQSSKTTTGAGGTGLGLPISRKIINDHCGRTWAENNPGGGTSFYFSIPKNGLQEQHS